MQHPTQNPDHARRSFREERIGGVETFIFTEFLARSVPAVRSGLACAYRAEPGTYLTKSGSLYLLADIPYGVEVVRVAGERSAVPSSSTDRFTAAAVVQVAGFDFIVLVELDDDRLVDALSTSPIVGFAPERPDGPFGPAAGASDRADDL